MTLVFGGAYQGKLEFAKKEFGIAEGDILNILELCNMAASKNDQDLNYGVDAIITEHSKGAKCIYGLDAYIRLMVERGLDSDKWIGDLIKGVSKDETPDKAPFPIIVMNDVSQGLVPMDAEDRGFREANGRALIRLAESATGVYRIFCGLPTRLK